MSNPGMAVCPCSARPRLRFYCGRRVADRVTLDVRPKGGLLRRLRRRGRAPVRARVTYDPLTGESESAVKRITLRLRRKR